MPSMGQAEAPPPFAHRLRPRNVELRCIRCIGLTKRGVGRPMFANTVQELQFATSSLRCCTADPPNERVGHVGEHAVVDRSLGGEV